MIHSMTGFGKASTQYGLRRYSVEIKSLNGKSSDIRIKLPANLKEYELLLRQKIISRLVRGKIDVNIALESDANELERLINKPVFKSYYNELKSLVDELNIQNTDLVSSIMNIPNVIVTNEYKLEEQEWKSILAMCSEAVKEINNYRKNEGQAIFSDLNGRVATIQSLIGQIAPFETERITHLRQKLLNHLDEYTTKSNVDLNRYEQELVYYIEKLDIHEEKIRLNQHCKYFSEVLRNNDFEKGRSLTFISQEMGREINTIGSKAQNSDIQKIVVQMKNELDQIKEQLANAI